jgi:hypothetical protein
MYLELITDNTNGYLHHFLSLTIEQVCLNYVQPRVAEDRSMAAINDFNQFSIKPNHS